MLFPLMHVLARPRQGSDETAFTWREQQHRAKEVGQSFDVSQPGHDKRTAVRHKRQLPQISKFIHQESLQQLEKGRQSVMLSKPPL